MDNHSFDSFGSLNFILYILVAALVTATLAPNHVQNTFQKVLFVVGVVTFMAGAVWRIVQRTKKVSQNKSVITQAVGTTIATLAILSGMIW